MSQTQLRAIRRQQLEVLNSEGFENVPRVPDGVAICATAHAIKSNLQIANSSETDHSSANSSTVIQQSMILSNPLSCYICHKPYLELHHFYHQLCPDCATYNFAKRDEIVDLTGKVCLVTGARVKIGYRCALKLLKCNANVIITTRFPKDAACRFIAEKDSSDWIKRLHIYGLDFRDIASLEKFCQHVSSQYTRLDVIINNACQTVRRPPAYYAPLINAEQDYFHSMNHSDNPSSDRGEDKKLKMLLTCQQEYVRSSYDAKDTSSSSSRLHLGGGMLHDSSTNSNVLAGDVYNHAASNDSHSRHIDALDGNTMEATASSDLTQLQVAPGDENFSSALFPTGATDVNQQQVDLRKSNSWTMKLHEVSTPEIAEVFAINALAPAILNAKLKSLMEKDKPGWKFIVNVSAMEGKFYRFKSADHPHTNMAKAALNMMTRTSAQDYVKSNIYMTAVDTGWINDEKPIERAVAHEKRHKFQTPLDEIDAAARVLDPVIGPLVCVGRGEKVEPPWGVFLKDFMKCEW